MMKKLLFVVWCVKLADQKPLHPEFTGQYIFATKQVKSSFSKSPSLKNIFGKTKLNDPGIAAVLTYKMPEEFNFPQPSLDSELLSKSSFNFHDPNSKLVSDDRVLYHSETNPLFKSKSLDLDDSEDYFKSIGNIHKITSPFESKWIFFPNIKNLMDESKTPRQNFQSLYSAYKNNLQDHPKKRDSSDSVFSAPSNLDLKRYNYNNLLSNVDSISSLRNHGLDDITSTLRDHKFNAIIDGNTGILNSLGNSLFDGISDIGDRYSLNEAPPQNTSYYGYNVKEVKTPQGEVKGVMQIFSTNGVTEKIHYNEKGVLNKTAPQTPKASKSAASTNINKSKPIIQNTNNKSHQNARESNNTQSNQSRRGYILVPVKPEVKKYSLSFEGHNTNNGTSPQTEFRKPEVILSDFFNKINAETSQIPDNVNVRTDVHNTFHETVSESSFSYS